MLEIKTLKILKFQLKCIVDCSFKPKINTQYFPIYFGINFGVM